MVASDGFSTAQRSAIDAAIREAETTSRFEFSVYVGPVAEREDTAAFARRLHAHLAQPRRSVLVLVDPNDRRLEIVTGSEVGRVLDDQALSLSAAALQSDLAAGNLAGGVAAAVRSLGERCRRPQVRHAATPES